MPPVPPPGFEHARVVPMRVDHSRIQEALEDFPAALILSATKKTGRISATSSSRSGTAANRSRSP